MTVKSAPSLKQSFAQSLQVGARVLLAVVLVVVASTPVSAKIIDRIAAQVNNDIVTDYELLEAAPTFLMNRQESPQQLQMPGFFETIRKPLLDDMVNRLLFQEDARRLGINISNAELEQYLANMRQFQGFSTEEEQAAALEQYGVSYPQFKKYAKSELLRMRLVRVKAGRNLNVSNEAVEKRYRELVGNDDGKRRFAVVSHINIVPESQDEADVATARAMIDTLHQRLVDGEDFATLAKEYSQDVATAPDGGEIGKIYQDNVLPEFADAAFATQAGTFSQPFQTPAGFHIVYVTEQGSEDDPNVAQKKNVIRNMLLQEEEQAIYRDYIEKLKQRSFIDIKAP